MTNSLREEIIDNVFDEGNSFPTVEQIVDFTISKIVKRIDARITELKSGMNDKKLKNLLPEEKWKGYYEKLEQSFDELEMLKEEILK